VTLPPIAQVIERAQINNKVFGETHIFSAYPFNSASQPMIGYDNTQDETISKVHAMISESTYMCVTFNKYQKSNTKKQNNTVGICYLVLVVCDFVIWSS